MAEKFGFSEVGKALGAGIIEISERLKAVERNLKELDQRLKRLEIKPNIDGKTD